MIVTLKTQSLSSLAKVRSFLDGNAEAAFLPPPEEDAHTWLAAKLRPFHYGTSNAPTMTKPSRPLR